MKIKKYIEFNEGKFSDFINKAKKGLKDLNAMPDDEIAEKILATVEKTTYLEVNEINNIERIDDSDYEKKLIETTLEINREKIRLAVGTITIYTSTSIGPPNLPHTHWKLSFDKIDINCQTSLKKKIFKSIKNTPEREEQRKKDDLKTFLR